MERVEQKSRQRNADAGLAEATAQAERAAAAYFVFRRQVWCRRPDGAALVAEAVDDVMAFALAHALEHHSQLCLALLDARDALACAEQSLARGRVAADAVLRRLARHGSEGLAA